ncbi:MAG: ABC transporter ATP-binding protein [Candidatus Woesearchaeota archaeon]|jgi:ABC-2 type transport system ATP-binding protein|nr:ABC transporter ATP-binding protein [Candidatus Woesearchaeota archaeon]MDP7199138.1 ABC transporter ATP-binding protein [Candidatus Woesearchaeota archaeon]MDP7467599.1 ABC transporter ATP-binding protein [Candidatus Woesearchaeota archaeon]MDP7647081.1 ABC transporter ATP-binding protein [Candidatus Woesearchaeota archaeon]
MGKKEVEATLLSSGWPKGIIHDYLHSAFRSFAGKLCVQDVKKSFDRPVLSSVSFTVKAGEIFGVSGPSGSGKSTLLNLLVGFIRPDEGRIYITKDDQELNVDKATNFFGLSTQTPSVYKDLTVLENLLHFATLYQLSPPEASRRAEKLVKMVGLASSSDVLASNLSGGMLKRLDIACALINNPYILILDEPTTGLDEDLRHSLWSLIKEINQKGTTVIVASHFVDEIGVLCDRMCYINQGTVREVDPTAAYRITLQTKSGKYGGLKGMGRKQGDEYVIITQDPQKALATIAASLTGEHITLLGLSPHIK